MRRQQVPSGLWVWRRSTLEGVGQRADAALNFFHPSGARDPRQQRDTTSRVTCVAWPHPGLARERRQAICARRRQGTGQPESCGDRWTGKPHCETSDTSSASASPQTGTGLRRGGLRRALLPVSRKTGIFGERQTHCSVQSGVAFGRVGWGPVTSGRRVPGKPGVA